MKRILKTLILAALFGISGCSQSNHGASEENQPGWKKLKCGLFLSPEGELGFASDPEIVNIPSSELRSERCPNVFITTLGSEHKLKLSSVVDTATFEALGAEFFKDRSKVYNYYAMCEGGYLSIFANDVETFEVLGCCYARYKNKIYHSRNGLMEADAGSFRTSSELGPYAKDKNGYFAFEGRTSEKQLRKDLGDRSFEKLKAL